MAYCSQCGSILPVNARFCSNCGTAVSNIDINKNTYIVNEGFLHVCPSCGDRLTSFTSTCPSCGHEIRNAHASLSVHEFSDKLSSSSTLHQKETILRSFPIPNTKEDIFEFLILASTNLTVDQHPSLYDAWLVKFEQCYQKALLVIKDSNDLTNINIIYSKTLKTIKKKNQGKNTSNMYSLLSRFFTLIVRSAAIIAGVAILFISIGIDRVHDNSSMHELIGIILLITHASILTKRDSSLIEILLSAGSGALCFYLSNYLRNGSMLQLGGVIVLIITAKSFFHKLKHS